MVFDGTVTYEMSLCGVGMADDIKEETGAGYRSRTDDLAITNRTLYQLS